VIGFLLPILQLQGINRSSILCTGIIQSLLIIHETEIKQFGNRNGRNRVEIISTLGHKSRIVETDYEGRNELRGSKRITRVETNYEDRNELRGSKRIIKVEMDYVVRALTD